MTTSNGLAPAGAPVALHRLVIPTAIAGGAFAIGAALTIAPAAAGSAALGTAVVLGFFGVTHLVLRKVLARVPELAMAAAVALYVTKVLAMFGLIFLVKHWGAIQAKPFGFAVLLCTLVWTTSEVLVHMRHRTLYIDPHAQQPTRD